MSMSIPIFFEPVSVTNEKTNREHVIVDGGMLSNFPVWLFDCPDDAVPTWPTFGLLLVSRIRRRRSARGSRPRSVPHGLGGLFKYVKAMADTMMEAHDRLYVEKANFARTIPIPPSIGTTEFDITPARRSRSTSQAAMPPRRSWRPGTSTATSRSSERQGASPPRGGCGADPGWPGTKRPGCPPAELLGGLRVLPRRDAAERLGDGQLGLAEDDVREALAEAGQEPDEGVERERVLLGDRSQLDEVALEREVDGRGGSP